MTIWDKEFWKALAERVLATAAGALLAALTADGFDVVGADWVGILVIVAVASLVSLLKGIVANVLTKDGPSLTHAEQTVAPPPVGGQIVS